MTSGHLFLFQALLFPNPLCLYISVNTGKISFLIFPTAYDRDRWERGHDANGKVPRLLQVTTYKIIFEHYANFRSSESRTMLASVLPSRDESRNKFLIYEKTEKQDPNTTAT